jgi:hypothetical protein
MAFELWDYSEPWVVSVLFAQQRGTSMSPVHSVSPPCATGKKTSRRGQSAHLCSALVESERYIFFPNARWCCGVREFWFIIWSIWDLGWLQLIIVRWVNQDQQTECLWAPSCTGFGSHIFSDINVIFSISAVGGCSVDLFCPPKLVCPMVF